jgi:hypothetical protein
MTQCAVEEARSAFFQYFSDFDFNFKLLSIITTGDRRLVFGSSTLRRNNKEWTGEIPKWLQRELCFDLRKVLPNEFVHREHRHHFLAKQFRQQLVAMNFRLVRGVL